MEPRDENFQIEGEKKSKLSYSPWRHKNTSCSQLTTKEAEASPFLAIMLAQASPFMPVMPLRHATQLWQTLLPEAVQAMSTHTGSPRMRKEEKIDPF